MSRNTDRYSEIGAKIREARESMGLSQSALAEEVGFASATAISLIEAGQRKVAVEQLEAIAQRLEKPIDFFLGNECEDISLEFALRSDKKLKNLGPKERQSILDFADFVRKQSGKR